MGFDPTEFRGRLKSSVNKGGGPARIASLTGIPKKTIENWYNTKALPTIGNVAPVAEACGVSLDWLASGGGEQVAKFVASGINGELDELSYLRLHEPWTASDAGPYLPEGYAEPPRYFAAFSTEWIKRIGVSPTYAQVLLASGDSMEPTICDGDLLLIDCGVTRVAENGIYALAIDGKVLVKRIQVRRDGSAALISDNPLYKDEAIPAGELRGLRVEGRVKWFGRAI